MREVAAILVISALFGAFLYGLLLLTAPGAVVSNPETRMNTACLDHKGVKQVTDSPLVVCRDGVVVRWRD